MKDSMQECALLALPPVRTRKGVGGPSSVDGKRRISQNARKHGCRSKEKILPGEEQADYEAVWTRWLEEYHPESALDMAQLQRIVDADWRLQRSERAHTEAERALHAQSQNPADWSSEQLHRLQVMQRYRTTAENSLHKEIRLLLTMRVQERAQERELQQLERQLREAQRVVEEDNPARAAQLRAEEAARQGTPTQAQRLFRGQRAIPAREDSSQCLEQTVEIRRVQGRVVTELFPSNDELIAEGQAMLPPPTFVERHMYFLDGVPAEYAWVGVSDWQQQAPGVCGMQRMTTDAWLDVIKREAVEGDGHVLPTPNVAEAAAREEDGCWCAACVKMAEIWRERLAAFS